MHPDKKHIVYFILGAMITGSINLLAAEALNIFMPTIKIIPFQLGIWAVVYLLLMFPRWIIPPIAWGSVFVLILSYYQNTMDVDVLFNFGKWAIGFIKGMESSVSTTYDIYLISILFGMVDMITGIMLLRPRKGYLLSLWSVFFIVEWYRYIDHAIRYFNVFIFSLVLLYIYESYEHYMKSSTKKHLVSNRLHFRYTAIYGIFSMMLIIGMGNAVSIEFEGLPVQSINDAVIGIFPSLTEWRSDVEDKGIESGFALEETPYQRNNRKLGGAIQEDKRVVMFVSGDRQLYLRGRVKSQYTGENWLTAQDKGDKPFENEGDRDDKGIFYEETKIEVYPTNLRTNTIFAPYKPYRVEIEGYDILRTKEDELYIEKSLFTPRPKSYIVHSRVPIIGEAYLSESHKTYGSEMNEYLQLPREMSPRIKELTLKITDGYLTDYEKMKGIEAYLRKTYPYALDVSSLPAHHEFVEYFLFEEKKGYCTYFASAMAVMGRMSDIPTRYVEGFILPDSKNENGYYEVTADRAHAWIEAYFDEMGWIAFEPTPAYEVQNGEIDPFSSRTATPNTSALLQRQNTGYLTFKNRLDEEFAGLNDTLDDDGAIGYEEMHPSNSVPKIIGGMIILILLTLFMRIGFCAMKIKQQRLSRERSGAVWDFYLSIEGLSRYLESRYEEGLTPRERLRRMEKYFDGNQDQDEIIQIIEKGLFGGKGLSLCEFEAVKGVEEKMEASVRKKLGNVLFLYHKFIKGSFYMKEQP